MDRPVAIAPTDSLLPTVRFLLFIVGTSAKQAMSGAASRSTLEREQTSPAFVVETCHKETRMRLWPLVSGFESQTSSRFMGWGRW